ncbi:MAG: LamG-like jellyroll fold domain-containing protein [Phycisphaerae bacterium]
MTCAHALSRQTLWVTLVSLLATVPALGQGSDACSTAQPISGSGTFVFNTLGATTGPEGQSNQNCTFAGSSNILKDVWFCWTADCDGLALISTCGQTTMDTKIAFYVGCVCPTPPPTPPALCCNDDGCGVQTVISCEVQCGHQYLIQLGSKPGTLPGSGTFTINCSGTPCPDQCHPNTSGTGCTGPCTQPVGGECVPVEITRNCQGEYIVTDCDCQNGGMCHVQLGPNGPECVLNCPMPQQVCQPQVYAKIDGSIVYRCFCTLPFSVSCGPQSVCDVQHPGTCFPACVGDCPPGQVCVPIELREFPVGSGNFTISQCECAPLNALPCRPIVVGGIVQCCGTCPTSNPCKVRRTLELPTPAGLGARYRCECRCIQPPANMLDWWPMDDNPAVFPINDIAGILNHGTPNAGVSPAPLSVSCVGGALFFNGTSGILTVPNLPGSGDINFGGGDFTLEGWIQNDFGQVGTFVILDKRVVSGAGYIGYHMFVQNGKLGFSFGSGGAATGNFVWTTGPTLTDGQCHHVAAVVDRGAINIIQLWVDGTSTLFTNSSVTGSVTNTAALRFGTRSIGFSPPDFWHGALDEWEFFARALAGTEIQALYSARSLGGKCRETCYAPRVNFCANHTVRNFCFQVCNYTSAPYSYDWNLSGPIGGLGCQNVGSITFTPSSGTTGVILPGQCKSVCVNMSRPSALPIPPPFLMGCYQLMVTNTTTANTFSCTGKITATKYWCVQCLPGWAIAAVKVGTTRHFALTVFNQGDPAGVLNYRLRPVHPEDDSTETRVLSLNGLPPGTRYIGNLSVPPGGSGMIPIDVTVNEAESFSPVEILVEYDADGDGETDGADRIAIQTLVPCQDGQPGDMNDDTAIDTADLVLFVDALVGMPADPYHLVLADLNCDGAANGADAQPFVNALLAGP